MIFSAVIPLKNEEKSLPVLHQELTDAFRKLGKEYEIVLVDDGSTDGSYDVLKTLEKEDKRVKIVKLRANFGKSYALARGFENASGKIIITLDADLQDNPKDIEKLVAKIDEGYDLVSGWRKKRADRLTKRISSLLFNKGTSIISGIKIHDFNCGLKAFKKEVTDELHLRGELHRFIPVLAAKNKFKVAEVIVENRKRTYGQSKYGKFGIGRSWKGIVDLLTALFVTEYFTKPAHFFGKIGFTLFGIGFIMDGYVTYIKITTGTTQGKIPLLIAGVLFMLIGVQLLSTGLIGEMIVSYFLRTRSDKKKTIE